MSAHDVEVGYESPSSDNIGDSQARDRKIRSISAQVLATTAKNTIIFSIGLLAGFPTIVIPQVHNAPANATISLTDEEVSWFGSIRFITNPMGCVASGLISTTFGRKRSMQALTIPLLISCIIFHYANSAAMLWSASALIGLTTGLIESSVLTYIGEISEPYLRGALSATSAISNVSGIFVEYLVGGFMDWRTLSIVNAAAPIFAFVVLFFVPESPHWLISKNRPEDTEKALRWLRGWTTKEHIQNEYINLVNEIQRSMKTDGDVTNRFCTFNVNNYLKRTFVVPFLLIGFTSFVGLFTGSTIFTYSVNIFNTFGAPMKGRYATIFIGLSRFLGPLIFMCLVHRTGKRPLVFVSLVGVAALYGTAGLYGHFYLGVKKLDNGAHVEEQFQGAPSYTWLPMACFIAVPIVGCLGIFMLLWLLLSELYPPEIRGFATGLSAGLSFLVSFVANKTFFDLISAFTLPGVFILYAVLLVVALVGFYFWLPETEGWSLEEIQEHFAGKRDLIKAGRKKKKNVQGRGNPVQFADKITKSES